MKGEFDSASRTPAPDIATKAELDQRLASRPTPSPQQVLTPNGVRTAEVHRQVNEEAERRIANLRNRLENAHANMNREHALSANHGRARVQFERSR